jgi:hypothetical protein
LCPTTEISPAPVSRRSTSEMVGVDSAVSSRRSALVSIPGSSKWAKAALSFMARSSFEEPAGRDIQLLPYYCNFT